MKSITRSIFYFVIPFLLVGSLPRYIGIATLKPGLAWIRYVDLGICIIGIINLYFFIYARLSRRKDAHASS